MRIGQYGPFVQRGEGGAGNTASIPDDFPPADLTIERALELLKAKAEGPRVLGVDPQTGQHVYVLHGRFGAYVQLGETPDKADKSAEKPKRASLTGGMTESTVTLDEALRLLSLPREIGRHPDDGEPILANFGRFGPYVKHGDEFRSLESDDQVFGDRSRARAGAAARAEEVAPPPGRDAHGAARARAASAERRGDEAARRALRPVRHRRHDQRVAAEGHRSRRAARSTKPSRCSRRGRGSRRRSGRRAGALARDAARRGRGGREGAAGDARARR